MHQLVKFEFPVFGLVVNEAPMNIFGDCDGDSLIV